MSKKILSEATVRRFQTLANIPGLKESHGRRFGETASGSEYPELGRSALALAEKKKPYDEEPEKELDESMNEMDYEMDEYDLGSLMNEADEEEPEEEKEPEEEVEEEEDMPEPEMDMGDEGAAGGMDKGKIEDALEKALKAMADSLAADLNLSIDVVSGAEEAAEEEAPEEEMAPPAPPAGGAGGAPELPPPPAGGEEEMAAMTESVRRLVDKVEARVKQRIQRATLEETLMRRVAARLLAASKKPVKADPKKTAKPAGKPVAPVKKK